jgi:hypothetical protein
MLGGSVELAIKNILFWFIINQTHFGMSRGAKLNLALHELKYVSFHSKSNTTSEHAPQVEKILDVVCKTTNGKQKGTNS